MNIAQVNRINYYNVLAMLVSAGLAVIIPFELFLLSYAILGPAHYLTEISWLRERRFFTIKKYDVLMVIAVIIITVLLKLPFANILYYAFGLSFILLVIKGRFRQILAFTVLVIAGYFLLTNNLLRTIFGVYLPTLVHVYIFTGAFLLLGALKYRHVSGYIAFAVFLACPVLLITLFTNHNIAPSAWAITNYSSHFASLNTITLRNQHLNIYTNTASIALTRVIAFAYTYHYINWFSKTRVINWHRIPIKRAIVIGAVWAASVTLYFYNYRLGLKWLFLLSLAHVILEFPLNHHSFIGIGREIMNRVGWRKLKETGLK